MKKYIYIDSIECIQCMHSSLCIGLYHLNVTNRMLFFLGPFLKAENHFKTLLNKILKRRIVIKAKISHTNLQLNSVALKRKKNVIKKKQYFSWCITLFIYWHACQWRLVYLSKRKWISYGRVYFCIIMRIYCMYNNVTAWPTIINWKVCKIVVSEERERERDGDKKK